MAAAAAIVAACAGTGRFGPEEANRRIRVFDARLRSADGIRAPEAPAATDEPCINGFERRYEALDVSLGYGFDGKVRRISTGNRATSVFGISPGDSGTEGKAKLVSAGFAPIGEGSRFGNGGIRVTLLADANGTIFSIAVEAD
jgi:hypothetical protein